MLGQISVNPTFTPTLNSGGWVYGAAVLLGVLGVLIVLAVVFGYMRLAPRFQTDEETRKRVRVPRMQPGKEIRRPVNVSSTPVIVQPPVLASVAVASPAAAAAPAPAAVAAAPAPAPAAAPAPTPAPAQAATAPTEAAAPDGQETAAAAAPAAPAPTPAPAAGEHKEITLDQETFDRVLAELLEKGTDRRVAEGQARRAAMIAARKKAEG